VNDGMEVVEAPALSITAEVHSGASCTVNSVKPIEQPYSDDVAGLIGELIIYTIPQEFYFLLEFVSLAFPYVNL
jgi:hypothetical protein